MALLVVCHKEAAVVVLTVVQDLYSLWHRLLYDMNMLYCCCTHYGAGLVFTLAPLVGWHDQAAVVLLIVFQLGTVSW